MYTEGIADLGEMILHLPIWQPEEKDTKLALIQQRTKNRYFPAFEKISEAVQRFASLSLETSRKTVAGHSWGTDLHFQWDFLNTNAALWLSRHFMQIDLEEQL